MTFLEEIVKAANVYKPIRMVRKSRGEPKIGSRYALALATNIAPITLKKFLDGKCGLHSDNLERLCIELGLELKYVGQPGL